MPTVVVVNISKLSKEGLLLDKGWKFKTGDNPAWAMAGYDDKTWQSINPTVDIHYLPQIPKSGIGWFRLHLSLDSSLLKRQLALVIQQSGASEIYFNGNKIQNFGTVSSNPENVKAYDPLWKPLSITFNALVDQVLAVRYVLEPNIFYTTIFETQNPALSIRAMYSDRAIDYYPKDTSFNASIQRDFDESIGKMNFIPQDIGRVLLNLYNNAFMQ